MTSDLNLNGPTPVIYFDPADELLDGRGWNALLANSGWAFRYSTLDAAVDCLRVLMAEGDRPDPDHCQHCGGPNH